MRLLRPLGIVLIVVIGVLAVGSVALAVLLVAGGVVGSRYSVSTFGTLTPVFAVPGAVFRPAGLAADRTGWRVGYVIASPSRTLVLSLPASKGGGLSITGSNGKNGLVTLTGATSEYVYEERPEGDLMALPDAATPAYVVTAFPPLRPGTTAVFVRHITRGGGGGTVRVPVHMARIAAAPALLRLNLSSISGKVRVTLTDLVSSALLSQVTLEARGFADPGGEQHTKGNMTSQRPPQTPADIVLRTSSGLVLATRVGVGPVANSVVTTVVGFDSPPRGSVVTLTVANFELGDLPPRRRTTRGHWSFTFRVP